MCVFEMLGFVTYSGHINKLSYFTNFQSVFCIKNVRLLDVAYSLDNFRKYST